MAPEDIHSALKVAHRLSPMLLERCSHRSIEVCLRVLSTWLKCEEPETMRAIADGTGISRMNMTQIIDALERAELVVRVDDEEDRRKKLIVPTQKLTDAFHPPQPKPKRPTQ